MASTSSGLARSISSRRSTLERQNSMERMPGADLAHDSLTSEYEKSVDIPYAVPDHIGSTPLSTTSHFLSTSLSADDSVFGPPRAPEQSFDSPNDNCPTTIPQLSSTPPDHKNTNNAFGAMQPLNMAGQRKRKHPLKPGKHVCQYCGRAWAKPSVLEKHIRMHTGERPYPCDICDQSFKTKSNLYKHRKSLAHRQKCQERGVSMGSIQESFSSSREESLDLEEGHSFADEDNQSNAASFSRSGSFGSAHSLEMTHPKVSNGDSKLNNNYNKPPNTEHPSKLLSAAEHLTYVETLRKLEQVYDIIEEYAKKMSMVISQRAHWIEDKHCMISVQLQQKDSRGNLVSFKARASVEVPSQPQSQTLKDSDVQARINQLIKTNSEIVSEVEIVRPRRLSRQTSISCPTTTTSSSSSPTKTPSIDVSGDQDQQSRNGPAVSGGVNILNSSTAVVNPEHLDGEELLKHIRQIIQSSCIDDNIKLLLHQHYMEVKLKMAIPSFHAGVPQPKLAHFYSHSFTSFDKSDQKKATLGFICQKCKTVFSKEHILELHTKLYCFPDDQQVVGHTSPAMQTLILPSKSLVHSFDELSVPDERPRSKLLKKASSEDISSRPERNLKQYRRSKSDLPTGERAQLVHQTSDGVSTKQQLKNHVLKHMSHGSLWTEASKSSSFQSSVSIASDDDIQHSPTVTPVKPQYPSPNPSASLPLTQSESTCDAVTASNKPQTSPVKNQSRDDTTPKVLPQAPSVDNTVAGCSVSSDSTVSNPPTSTIQYYIPNVIPTVVTEDADDDTHTNSKVETTALKPTKHFRPEDAVPQQHLLHPGKSFGKLIENPPDKPPDDLFESSTIDVVEISDTPTTVEDRTSEPTKQSTNMPQTIHSPKLRTSPLTIETSLMPVSKEPTAQQAGPPTIIQSVGAPVATPASQAVRAPASQAVRAPASQTVSPRISVNAPTASSHQTSIAVPSSNLESVFEVQYVAKASPQNQLQVSPRSISGQTRAVISSTSNMTVSNLAASIMTATNMTSSASVSLSIPVTSIPVSLTGKHQNVSTNNLAVMTTSIQPSRVSFSAKRTPVPNLIPSTVNIPQQSTAAAMTNILPGGFYQMPRLPGVLPAGIAASLPAGYIPRPIHQPITGISVTGGQSSLPIRGFPTMATRLPASPAGAMLSPNPIILSPLVINSPAVSGSSMLTLAMPSPPIRAAMSPLAFLRSPLPNSKSPVLPMSPLVKSSSFDKSSLKKKKFELHPSTPDSYKESMPGPSSLKYHSHRPSLEKTRSHSKDVLEGCASPRVSFNKSLTTYPTQLLTENSSVKLKRRRFSQTKSQSSVSFDDPVSIVLNPKEKSQQTSKSATVTQTSSLLMPVNRIAINVAAPGLQSSVDTRVGNIPVTASAYKTIPIPVSSFNQSTSSMTLTSIHPVTYQLYLSKKPVRPSVHHPFSRTDIQKMNRESLSVECRPSYCTLHVRRPCHKEFVRLGSVYNQWKSLTLPPTAGRVLMDGKIPMNCYKTRKHGIRSSLTSKISNMDTRGILTHSSYWQYKNKLRVMQAMPSQDGAPAQDYHILREGKSLPLKQQSRSQSISGLPSAVPAMPSIVKHDHSNKVPLPNTNRPSVITRDIKPPISTHQKILQRSQSTPNAGAEGQSKLIAGGFKSDEDYVYIRGRGKGKYVCQQCGIRCRKPSMLKKHIRTHTDLRPYSCKHCNFSFKTKGNLTKHMRSKAHYRRCLELNIVPVPSSVDESQIDQEILASQQKLSRISKIKGSGVGAGDDDDDDDSDGSSGSEDDDCSDDDDEGDSSNDDSTLHIDEKNDSIDPSKSDGEESPTLAGASLSLRRAQSMPAHHIANSFDASSLAEILPEEPAPIPRPVVEVTAPPPKKRKKNHLNLTISTSKAKQLDVNSEPMSSKEIEDDIARSLLDLSKTPVHGTPTPQGLTFKHRTSLGKVGTPLSFDKSVPKACGDVRRVSVVRSAKPSLPSEQSEDEPMDLRVPNRAADIRFVCHLCRAICSSQELLESHMKLHSGKVIDVPTPNKQLKRSSSQSFAGSVDNEPPIKQAPPRTPRTPSTPLRRQHAVSIFDSDAEDDEVDHHTIIEPGEKPSDDVMKRKCPYCPKIFMEEKYVPIHVKSHHLIAQEYVCTYKECGEKFTNKQDLTYHLGTHALDDTDKYQPLSIPKCGVCEKTFKSVSSLKQHLAHHNDARPHVCEYCDAGFTKAQSLKHHLKTHTQERPYVCGECGNTFARSDHLSQHAKIHARNAARQQDYTQVQSGPTIHTPSGHAATDNRSFR